MVTTTSILDSQASANAAAWYGAVVGTLGICLSIYNAWIDKARIKITYQRNMRLLDAHPPWSSDKTYLSIEITNIGRRPVAIGNVGIKYFSGSGALIAHSLIEQEKRVLTEENPQTHILADESELDFPNIRYIAVYDKKGQEHRKYVSIFPTIQKALFRPRKKKPNPD